MKLRAGRLIANAVIPRRCPIATARTTGWTRGCDHSFAKSINPEKKRFANVIRAATARGVTAPIRAFSAHPARRRRMSASIG